MTEPFGWVLILILSTLGAIMFLHSRLVKIERDTLKQAIMLAKATKIIEDMTEEQQRVANILANYVAWEENDDGQEKKNSG